MIRYPTSDPIELIVDAALPRWRQRALVQTAQNEGARRHSSPNKMWWKLKPIFIRLQREKCAYCERSIGQSVIEWDLEHYRPKGRVTKWTSTSARRRSYGAANKIGYYRLAFDPSNYLASCKTCNSVRKRDYFPVAGRRRVRAAAAHELAAERPLLVFPLGDRDVDPEELIGFLGPVPQPLADPGGLDWIRAVVTIELFGLDTREELLRERSQRILDVWIAFRAEQSGDVSMREEGARALQRLCDTSYSHTSCARSFLRLCHRDFGTAERLREAASEYLGFPDP